MPSTSLKRVRVVAALGFFLSAALLPVSQRATSAASAIGYRNCPFPLRVTLTFLSSQQPVGSSRGSNTYRVDWAPIGTVPGNDGAPNASRTAFNYRVTVVDLLGSASVPVQGERNTATVVVERTRSTPLASITPFAAVEGKADLHSCNNVISYDSQRGSSETSSPTCAVPMRFSRNPSVVALSKMLSNGLRVPAGFGVRSDWAALVGSVNCVSLAGFELEIGVRFADGGQRTFTESLAPDVRSRTTEVTSSPLAANQPVIQHVTIRAITSLTLAGSSPH